MQDNRSDSSREEYLELFREEVERCKATGNWSTAVFRVWIHLRVAPEVILSAQGQRSWKAIQEGATAGSLEPLHTWLFIDEEMQDYMHLVPPDEIPRFKTGLLRSLWRMEI